MKSIVFVQSLILVLVVSVGMTINKEQAEKLEEKERSEKMLADELAHWKNQYEDRLNELNLIIEASNQVVDSEIELVSYNSREQSVNYDDFKSRKAFVNEIMKDSEGKFQESWAYFLIEKATELNVNPYIAYELIKLETGGTFDPNLVGPDTRYGNARGLGQIMHSNTAAWLASMAGLEYKGKEQLFDPYYSIELTVVYLDFLYNRYGNWEEALTAYNRGMYGLEQYKAQRGHARSSYAMQILENVNMD